MSAADQVLPADRGTGPSGAGPLLSAAGRRFAVASVVFCVLVTALQAVWLKHGMETSWLDKAVDAKVRASVGGHPVLLAALAWPGEPVAVLAAAAALLLACILRRLNNEAALVAVSVPLAAALAQFVLKPLTGRTYWGDPFPSGHVTSVVALATVLAVLLARTPARVPGLARLVLAITAFLITAAVALGVIGARMHHFADTVGGAAVGTGTVLATALVLDLLSARLNAAARRGSLRTCLPADERRSAAGDHELTRPPTEQAFGAPGSVSTRRRWLNVYACDCRHPDGRRFTLFALRARLIILSPNMRRTSVDLVMLPRLGETRWRERRC